MDPSRYWNPKLYIENAYGDPKEQFRHRVMFNEKGEAFISEKRTVKGTFMENLELDDFPFDVQVRQSIRTICLNRISKSLSSSVLAASSVSSL